MDENKNLNGLDMPALNEAIAVVGAQPASAHAPKSSRIRWVKGLKFKAQVRNHSFMIDEPSHLTGDDESPNSMEYVLGAYGACLATGFVLNASQRGITIRNLEVSLESSQNNVFTFLGLQDTDKGHPGFEEIKAKLFVQANADRDTLQEIWEHTIKTSPVHNSLTRPVKINPELDVIG